MICFFFTFSELQTVLEAKGVSTRGGSDDDDNEDEDDDGGMDVVTDKEDTNAKATCYLLWRGQVARREFDKFKLEIVESVAETQRILQAKNCSHIWEASLRFDPAFSTVAVDDL